MSETFNELVDAFKEYQKIPNLETLRKSTPEQREIIRSYKIEYHSLGSTPIDSLEDLKNYERAEAALIEALNNYIDARIEQLNKSID